MIDAELDFRLAAYAAETGKSREAVVRQAVEKFLDEEDRHRNQAPMATFVDTRTGTVVAMGRRDGQPYYLKRSPQYEADWVEITEEEYVGIIYERDATPSS